MKLFAAIAAVCLCASLSAQVQIGKSVQIGGSGGTGSPPAGNPLDVQTNLNGTSFGADPGLFFYTGGTTHQLSTVNQSMTGSFQITGTGSQFIGVTNPATGYAATWNNVYTTKLNSPVDFVRNPYFGGPGGFNYGNGPGVSTNWTTDALNYWNVMFARRGITQFFSTSTVKRATGDYAGRYANQVWGVGGLTGASDEGGVGDKIIGGQAPTWYSGTATAGAATGSTLLPITAGVQTCDGCFVYDASRLGPAGHFTGLPTLVTLGTANYYSEPIDTPVTPSTAFGVPVCTLPQLADQTVPQTVACTVTGALGSTGVFVNGIASLSGPYAEQVAITVSAPSGGSQTVNITYRNPHVSGQFILWQGGTAQGVLQALPAWTAINGMPNGETVFGAPDSTHLAAGVAFGGGVSAPDTNYSAPIAITSITKAGSIATAVMSLPYASFVPFSGLASATISGTAGCTGGSMNGTATTVTANFQNATISWTDATSSTGCTSGLIGLLPSTVAYQLYPYAEQIAAGDVSTQVKLEPNIAPFASGDNLVQPHPPTFDYNALWHDTRIYNINGRGTSTGIFSTFAGAGIGGLFNFIRLDNNNPCSMYQGCGGSLTLNPWLALNGPNWGTIASTIPINPTKFAMSFGCAAGYTCTDIENVLAVPLGNITLDSVNGWTLSGGPGINVPGNGKFNGVVSSRGITSPYLYATNLNSDTNPPLTLQEQYVGDNFCRGEYFVQQVGQPWGHVCAYHFVDGGDAYGLGFDVGWNLTRALTLTLDQNAPRAIFPGLVTITSPGSLVTPSASVVAASTTGDIAKFDNTTGHLADSGIGSSSIALLGVSNTWTAPQSFPAPLTVSGAAGIRTNTASNTDVAGQLTLVAGTQTFTFAGTYTSAPICVASDTTATNAVKVSATTTVLTLTGTGTDVVNYVCIGRN